MTWTTQTPDEPGWYWYRSDHYHASIVLVERRKGDGTLRMCSDEWAFTSNLPRHGEWCGPLEVPK